jgi:hypothetical protein
MGGGHPSLAAIAARSEVSPINRRIGLMARPAAATLSPEIHAPKELIKTRTAMKGLEVLASDPNRNIRVSFSNGLFQERQRRFRIFERGSHECLFACRAQTADSPSPPEWPADAPRPAGGQNAHRPRREAPNRSSHEERRRAFSRSERRLLHGVPGEGCRSVVDEQLQGRCARRGCPLALYRR